MVLALAGDSTTTSVPPVATLRAERFAAGTPARTSAASAASPASTSATSGAARATLGLGADLGADLGAATRRAFFAPAASAASAFGFGPLAGGATSLRVFLLVLGAFAILRSLRGAENSDPGAARTAPRARATGDRPGWRPARGRPPCPPRRRGA